MGISTELKIWAVLAGVTFAGLWLLSEALSPFIIGMIVAYLCNPLVGHFEKITRSRIGAVMLLALVVLLLIGGFFITIIPLFLEQAFLLIEQLPAFFKRFATFIESNFLERLDLENAHTEALANLGNTLSSKMGEVLNLLFQQANSVFNFIMTLVIAPVVAVYLLIDWSRMVANTDTLLPREYAPKIRQLLTEIDQTLAAFLRGQATVCLLLGLFYAIGLSLSGLNFAILIGAVAGVLTFIPYLGAIIGAALALGAASFQFWGEWGQIALIALVFAVGQFVEGNIITPKLVGKSIRLHPVWILLALAVLGKMFGFIGVLCAVPIAAIIGVLIRHALANYKQTRLYKGKSAEERRE